MLDINKMSRRKAIGSIAALAAAPGIVIASNPSPGATQPENPCPIWTPLQVSGGATMEKLETFGGNTPLVRPGQPVELASIYVQLAANDASFSTGHIYGASGGGGNP